MSDETPTREYAAFEDEIDLDHLDEKQKALVRLALVDADLARWLVYDGQLSEHPLDRPELDPWLRELRERRLAAVEALAAAVGRDPHPTFLREPTKEQRDANERRLRLVRVAADLADARSMTLEEAEARLRRAW